MNRAWNAQDLLGSPELLRWELRYQDRRGLGRLLCGPGAIPTTSPAVRTTDDSDGMAGC